MKSLKDIIAEGVAVSSDFKLVNTVNAQGKPVTRKVRAHRKTISPQSNEAEEKPDVLASIQKFVGRQYNEDVEQIDEISTDGYHKAAVKSRQDAALKVMSSMGQDKQAKTKLDARNKGLKRLSDRTSADMKKANSGPQLPRVEKEPTEAERRGYGQGRYMGDSVELDGELIEGKKPVKSASIRWQEALQRAKKQRETEEARKKENEKRALTPKPTNEAKDPREYDYEGDMAKTQLRSIIANSQAVHDMLKDTTNLAEWVQSKITKAEDYISTVADYMTAEMNEQHVVEAKKEDDEEDYSKNHKLDPDSGVEADQHIHVQLKKAIDSTMKPYEVSFKNGKTHSVSSPVAKTIVTAIEKLKPEHRKAAHDELHKSYDSLMAVHKAITGK